LYFDQRKFQSIQKINISKELIRGLEVKGRIVFNHVHGGDCRLDAPENQSECKVSLILYRTGSRIDWDEMVSAVKGVANAGGRKIILLLINLVPDRSISLPKDSPCPVVQFDLNDSGQFVVPPQASEDPFISVSRLL